ncbi:hypothetical protein FQR65_LT20848 [Abscondita terminalis]|nr:hypothetical protein FQR65_LT20848 [Abscondita terminalis]
MTTFQKRNNRVTATVRIKPHPQKQPFENVRDGETFERKKLEVKLRNEKAQIFNHIIFEDALKLYRDEISVKKKASRQEIGKINFILKDMDCNIPLTEQILDKDGMPVFICGGDDEYAAAYKFEHTGALKANELMMKHLGMLSDKVKHEHTGADGGPIDLSIRLVFENDEEETLAMVVLSIVGLFFIDIPDRNRDLVNIVLGAIIGWGTTVFGFYFGNSDKAMKEKSNE